MKNTTRNLLLIFFILVIIKIVLASFILSPTIFADEYHYSKMARSFFFEHKFFNNDVPTRQYAPLYSIITSVSYSFQESTTIFFVMKIINSILSSLIIFPIFLLAKEFLTRKKALFISFLVSILPMSFSASNYIMAENLFYPLVAFSIYFLYKSFKLNKRKYFILAGIFIGLTLLTKITALALIPIALIIFFFRKKQTGFIDIIIHYLFILVIISPWIIRNIYHFGWSLMNLFGTDMLGTVSGPVTYGAFNYPLMIRILSSINLFVLYLGFLILSSGIVFGIYYLKTHKSKDSNLRLFYLISIIALIFFVLGSTMLSINLIDSYESPFSFFKGRIVGRIVDSMLPFIILIGFITFNKREEKNNKKYFIITTIILIIASQLFVGRLFPFNNHSLTLFGILALSTNFLITKTITFAFNWYAFLIFLFILIVLSFLVYKLKDRKKLVINILLIFFILTSLSSYAITGYNSNSVWYPNEQIQLGLYIDKITDKEDTILFDERDCGENLNKGTICEKYEDGSAMAVAGFFVNKKIIIGNIDRKTDYIVSKHTLNLPIIKKTENEIYLYKAKRG